MSYPYVPSPPPLATSLVSGLVSTATQSFSGNKTFIGTISASNFTGTSSGTNTGDISVGAFGSTPDAKGASLSSQTLTLQPADATHPGAVTTGTQTIAGAKTLSSALTLSLDSGNSLIVDTNALVVDATNNRVGVGTASPSEALQVVGNVRFSGALMPNNLPGTSGQVLTSAGSGSVPSWKAGSGVFNVKDYWAVGDGETDDTAAIQSAITAAQAQYVAGNGIGTVFFPPGTFLVNTKLNLSVTPVVVRGSGLLGSTVKAGATMTSVFDFTNTSSQNEFFQFFDLRINGNSNADYCISSTKIDHSIFQRLYLMGSKICALNIGYGWDNDILECEILYNTLDGIRLSGTSNNGVNILNCKIGVGGGIGVNVINGGGPINITGCTLESNAICALYAWGCYGLNYSGNYHEANAQTGYAFATPAKTVHSDIILNGSSVSTIQSEAYPVYGCKIGNNWFSNTYSTSGLIWLIAADGLTVENNSCASATSPTLIGTPLNLNLYIHKLVVRANAGVTTTWNGTDFITNQCPPSALDWDFDSVPLHNYYTSDLLSLAKIVDNSNPAAPIRSSTNRYGEDVWEFPAVAGQSDYYGITISVDNNPEIANQWMVLSSELKIGGTSATQGITAYASGIGSSTDGYFVSTDWNESSMIFKAPGSGTFTLGFGKFGANAIASVFRPILTLVGSPRRLYFKDKAGPNYLRHEASAAPVSGTWPVGTIVYNSAPAPGLPSGWTCTTAGTPGTWKAFDVLPKHTATSASTYTPGGYGEKVTKTGSGVLTVTLPLASTVEAGSEYTITDGYGNANTANITIARSGSDLISGQTSQVITGQYNSVTVVCDGVSNYYII